MKITRPPLRYFGSKWRLYQWIKNFIPPHETFVELFGGGASVLLQKEPSPIEVYCEKSDRVVNFFKVLRDYPQELYQQVILTPYSISEYKKALKDEGNEIERARRLFVYCWQGFSPSLGCTDSWRVSYTIQSSSLRNFNEVPEQFLAAAMRLKNVYIHDDGDYESVIKRYDSSKTLFYVDPPYLHDSNRTHDNDYEYEFSRDDHINLAKSLANIQGKAIVSSYHSELYNDMYKDWQLEIKKSQNLNHKSQKSECLWLSPNFISNRLF